MLFKALQHLTCEGTDYGPGEIVPGAASFQNLKEMIECRYMGYATEEETKTYQAEQQRLEKLAKKKEKQAGDVKATEETDEEQATEEQTTQEQTAEVVVEAVQEVVQEEAPK